jgi:predicted transcriptional regulator YheO
VGSTPGLEPDDVDFLRAVQPIVEFLGGTLSTDAGVGDLVIERAGRRVAYVRGTELHGALDRTIEAVERDVGAELSEMTREQKQVAVRTLDEQGVFLLRGAVDRVSRSMGVSRVTLYSYLNALERRA